MRKLLPLIACIALIACQRSAFERTKKVTFTLSGVETGSLSKALADDVSDALSFTAPTSNAYLVIQSKTVQTRTYTGVVGQPVTLAYDKYDIAGEYTPESHGMMFASKVYYQPCYSVSGDIEVTDADSTYPLDASYECFALILDYSKVATIELSSSAKAVSDCTNQFQNCGKVGILYLATPSAYTVSSPFKVRVYPKDEAGYEYAEYLLSGTGGGSTIKVEKGKWYCFTPTAVETTSGDFSISLPAFENGTPE